LAGEAIVDSPDYFMQ